MRQRKPHEISTVKRKVGRPRGIKERKPRRRSERVVPPPDLVWHDKRQAAGRIGVSVSLIDKNLSAIGATKIGDRIVIHRDRLDEWALSLSSQAQPSTRRKTDDGPRAAP